MKTSIASKIAGLAFAAAIIVGSTASFSGGETAGLDRGDAIRMSKPAGGITDPTVYNRGVLSGNSYGS